MKQTISVLLLAVAFVALAQTQKNGGGEQATRPRKRSSTLKTTG